MIRRIIHQVYLDIDSTVSSKLIEQIDEVAWSRKKHDAKASVFSEDDPQGLRIYTFTDYLDAVYFSNWVSTVRPSKIRVTKTESVDYTKDSEHDGF